MPQYSPQFIEKVRTANDIVEVIGASLPLKRAGTNFVTLCPFHKEKSPSFNVSPSRQIFHCFGCHAGGDVFKFIQQYENLGFPEAVERLAERARLPPEFDQDPAAARARGNRDQLLSLHEAICQRWQQCLGQEAGGETARQYLQRRGVGAGAIREFRIGAAPDAWDDTVNWARNRGLEPALCEQAGLIVRHAETGRHYDRFRGRLMFPICDEQGRVIAFSGRILEGDEKTGKYVNSPETPLFTKGRVLFALDKARRPIIEAGHAIICEGQLDTIACHAAGIRNVIAPQGTALTAGHARILKRYANEVVLCFDGDKAGRAAAVRSLDDCLGSGLAIKVATIPAPHDPDSYMKNHGADAFRIILSNAREFFDFYLALLCEENDSASDKGRLAITRSMAEKLHQAGNAVVLDTYAQKTAQRLAVRVEAVRAEFVKSRSVPRPSHDDEDEPDATPAEPTPPPKPEFWLLKYLCLADTQMLDWAVSHLDTNWISHPAVRRIIEIRLHQTSAGGDGDLGRLLQELSDDEEARRLVTGAASDSRAIPNPGVQLTETTRRLRDAWFDRQIAEILVCLGDNALPQEQQHMLQRRHLQLRAAKRQPLTPLADA